MKSIFRKFEMDILAFSNSEGIPHCPKLFGLYVKKHNLFGLYLQPSPSPLIRAGYFPDVGLACEPVYLAATMSSAASVTLEHCPTPTVGVRWRSAFRGTRPTAPTRSILATLPKCLLACCGLSVPCLRLPCDSVLPEAPRAPDPALHRQAFRQ